MINARFFVTQSPAPTPGLRPKGHRACVYSCAMSSFREHSFALSPVGEPGSAPPPARQSTDDTQKYLKLLSTLSDSILVLEGSGADTGTILEANPAACIAHALAMEDLIGLSCHQLEDTETAKQSRTHLADLSPAGTIRWEGWHVRADGSRFPVEVCASRLISGGGSRILAVVRDITTRRAAEGALQEREALQRQLIQIQKLDALGALAGGLAHEFNNILGAIMGNAQVAQMDLAPGHPSSVSLDEVLKASKRARDLVRRILNFNRSQEEERAVVSLDQVLTEAFSLIRASLPSSVAIERSLEPGLPSVLADVSQIHQVLVHLSTRAARSMAGGKGTLRFHLKGCTLTGDSTGKPAELPPGNYAQLIVSDNGQAIPPDSLAQLFDPASGVRPPGSLGLWVVKGILRQLGGTILVESIEGAGTAFRIYLPAAAATATVPAAPVSEEGLPRGSGQRILVVDDEPLTLNCLARMLSRLGYSPTAVDSPGAALELVQPAPNAFSAFIIDLSMPGMGGIELAHSLRDLGASSPIILNSGVLAVEEAREIHRDSRHAFLSKPNTLQDLATALNKSLSNERQT